MCGLGVCQKRALSLYAETGTPLGNWDSPRTLSFPRFPSHFLVAVIVLKSVIWFVKRKVVGFVVEDLVTLCGEDRGCSPLQLLCFLRLNSLRWNCWASGCSCAD